MLSSILIRLFGPKLGVALARVLPYLIALGVILFAAMASYKYGVRTTDLKYKEAIVEERQRVLEANREALNTALRKITELQNNLSLRNEELERLREEAEADPDAGNHAIGVDSVRRIDSVH